MKNITFFLAFLVSSAVHAELKVISLNTLCDSCDNQPHFNGQYGEWNTRKAGLYTLINSHNPDLVAFQELQDVLVGNTTTMVQDVTSEFTGTYDFYNGTLQTDGPEKYRNVIMYKQSVFQFLSGGSFRLSDQIDDGSVFDPYTRICTWAIFETNNEPLKVYNCHYPSLNPSGQIVASQTVIDSIGTEKTIVMGDFNTAWNAVPITMFHDRGFGDSDLLSRVAPDHILSNLVIFSYDETITPDSDHPMITAEIKAPVSFQPAIIPIVSELVLEHVDD